VGVWPITTYSSKNIIHCLSWAELG